MKYLFKSLFAKDILAYINLRCSLGNKEDTFGRRLHSFDEFCMEHYPDTLFLTQELAESWCTLRPNEKKTLLSFELTFSGDSQSILTALESLLT